MTEFSEKNASTFGADLTNKVNLQELFKPGTVNSQNGLNPLNNIDFNNLFGNLDKNPLFLSTLESIKNISRNISNLNYGINNVRNFLKNQNVQINKDLNLNTPNSFNNINPFQFQQKENSQFFKINSETSSVSLSSDNNKVKEILKTNKGVNKYFNSSRSVNGQTDNFHQFTIKKRKRYIKNNKFVYVHPGSAAAKKMELEKIVNLILKDV